MTYNFNNSYQTEHFQLFFLTIILHFCDINKPFSKYNFNIQEFKKTIFEMLFRLKNEHFRL